MYRLVKYFICFFLFSSSFIAHADRNMLHQRNVKLFIREMVNQYHFDKKQLTAILTEATFQPKIIASMEQPYEKKNWDVYKSLFLTQDRVESGVRFWQENKQTLEQVEKQYGVPAEVIVAIIGVETRYGKNQGNYRVLDALSTLAFYYPKRSEFFTKELREYLLLCREQHVPVTQYMGSYAGAIGKPQFMPSSYRFYAIDFNKKGKADLTSEDQDVISSVANYFAKHGWKMNEVVAEPARVYGDAYKQLNMNSRSPNYAFTHLLAAGVKPEVSKMQHPGQAGVIELMTDNGSEYWLAYPNFYVITKYNTSPQYALVVYLLSQELRGKLV
ncbi:MAG: lytic murein transglycosylase B [Legionellaceae bacterium]|nr:lytic murein transglycosylase B [Legionellaceae bacterium]